MSLWSRASIAGIFCIISTLCAAAGTLENVKERGHLECGLTAGLPGLANGAGNDLKGLNVEICHALAAAIFDDPDKVKFTAVKQDRPFDQLRFGEVDVLLLHSGLTMLRDTTYGIRFAATTFYDGQGFMVRKALGVGSALELSGATICLHPGTMEEQNIKVYFQSKKLPFEPVPVEEKENDHEAYLAKRCGVYSGLVTGLHAARLQFPKPEEHVVLPEVISKEAVGAYARDGDRQWLGLIKWVIFALINAEELGVTAANAEDMKSAANPAVLRLLGQDGDYGKGLGLDAEWAYRVISRIGNYAEIYDRTVGSKGVLKVERGLNALWNKGGILYAPPVR